MANTYTKGYGDGSALTESMLDTAYQTLQADITNTALMTTGSTTGQALTSNGSAVAASFQTIPDPQGPFALRNYGLKATVATGVMTVSLTTKAGTAPSGSDKADFNYSTNGTTSGTYSSVQVSSAVTFTLNASATLGLASTATNRIYVYGYYNTATASVKLALAGRADLDTGTSVTTTAVSSAADELQILYGSGALTVMPRLLGWVESARNSSGAWQTPSKVNVTNSSDCAVWGNWIPTFTSSTTVASSTIVTAKAMISNKTCYFTIVASVRMGTAAGQLYLTLPCSSAADLVSSENLGCGAAAGTTSFRGLFVMGDPATPVTKMTIQFSDGATNFTASANTFRVSGSYRV